jgi:hypothetical protein
MGLREQRKGNAMGATNPVIVRVTAPERGTVIVETSDGRRVFSSLSPLESVYCYPRTKEEWAQVHPDADGLALVWTTRFEVHVDQVLGLATRVERIEQSA